MFVVEVRLTTHYSASSIQHSFCVVDVYHLHLQDHHLAIHLGQEELPRDSNSQLPEPDLGTLYFIALLPC